MERMPSASEMERYKQEMMDLYRRANPNLTPVPSNPRPERKPEEEIAARPIPMRETEPPQPAPQPTINTPPTPRTIPDQSMMPEEAAIPTPSPATPSTVNENIIPQIAPQPAALRPEAPPIDRADEETRRPRFPEDLPEEPPYPEDAMPARRAFDGIPTEAGTGEPAAADENAVIANPAFPGELINGSDTPATSLEDIQNYVELPLPDEYRERYPEVGYIRVRVSSSRQALPIENAGIAISKKIGSNRHILHRETSDQSGLTPNLPVPAPDGNSSTQPDSDGQPRFATYDIFVDRVGYVPVFYHSVPVFSNIVTVQPVQMIPLSDNPSGRQLIEINAPRPQEQ